MQPYVFVNSEAAAAVAAFTAPPNDTRKALIDNLVGGLKTDSLWTSIALFKVHAAHASQAGLVDWVTPATVGTLVNAVTFTVDRGFASNGTTSYVDHSVAFAGLATVAVDNVTCLVWSLTDQQSSGATNGADFGAASGGTMFILGRNSSGNLRVRTGDSGNTDVATADSLGLYGYRRDSTLALGGAILKNGVEVAQPVGVATGFPTGNIRTCDGSGLFGSTRVMAVSVVMTNKAASDQVKLYNRLLTYLQGVGAA